MLRSTSYQYGDLIGARGELWTFDSEGAHGVWAWGMGNKEHSFEFLYFSEIEESGQTFHRRSMGENLSELHKERMSI